MTQDQIIGKNIREYRKRIKLSQQSFADFLGISREEVSYYETGARPFPTKLMSKTSELFAIDEYDLYEDDMMTNSINLAFAFRAIDIEPGDLDAIAEFKKISLNYLKMKKVLIESE